MTASNARAWDLINAKARLDSFTYEQMTKLIEALRASGQRRLAIDLKATRFISLAAIKFICTTAQELRAEGGELAIVAASDKTIRHFEIYGSLDVLRMAKDEGDLAASLLGGPPAEIRRHELRASDSSAATPIEI